MNDHLFGKELFIRFTAFRKLPSVYVFSYFPFGFEGRMWDLIVSVPDHCLSFYFPTMYWLPKLHKKKTYKARFIANSSYCTTTELSKLLTSCLTAVKNHVIRYCEKVYERSGKNLFWSIKSSDEVLNKLKSREFRATSLSTYDFSTLYTTLPYNLIKEKIINLIEWTFKREGSPYIACNERQTFYTSEDTKR